jgi:hypothetical protein
MAHEYAAKEKLWEKGKMPARSFWRRILDFLTPWKKGQRKTEETNLRGRWYRWALKKLSKQARDQLRDPDMITFERARKRAWRKFHEKQAIAAEAARR